MVDKTGKSIANTICDILTQNSFNLNNIVLQLYDFPSSMSGKKLVRYLD